jgi:hypothetical protein
MESAIPRRTKNVFLSFSFVAILAAGLWTADAACREDPRSTTIDGTNVVRLKSYKCRISEGKADIVAVEFYRLSDAAAGLIMQNRSSKLLKKAIGSPRLIENDVSRTYSDLIEKFGEATDRPIFFHLESPGLAAVGDKERQGPADDGYGEIKVLLPTFPAIVSGGPPILHSYLYPAVDEIATLRKRIIPRGMKFFYMSQCKDPSDYDSGKEPEICKEYAATTMVFWRGLQANDVGRYGNSLREFNRLVGHFSDVGNLEIDSFDTPKPLQALRYIGGEEPWPEDFAPLVGGLKVPDCGQGDTWEFWYLLRTLLVDAVVIENVSDHAINIDALLAATSLQRKLRSASTFANSAKNSLGLLGLLSPGQRIVVPTRISLSPSDDFGWFFARQRHAAEVNKRVGSSGFSGNAAHAVPEFKDHDFGPSLKVEGAYIDGNVVEFDRRSANFVDIVLGWGAYSCPYLMSWNSGERRWTNHGKILHMANSRQDLYSETTTFTGLRQRFRIEEREPEAAFIDQAKLTVTLKNQQILTLSPNNPALVECDDNYLSLYWGEAINFEFALPEGVAADAVVESRLTLTGYYEPYSNQVAATIPSRVLTTKPQANYCRAN